MPPAMAVEFSDIPYDRPTWEHTKSAARQIKENGGALLLTLEPHGGLDTVSPEVIRTLAYDLLDLNNSGVAVIVRFAHEMNGSWYAWGGQQPDHYKAVFRQVADAVHHIAPGGSAMMWAPNYGGGYPFSGGKFAAAPGTEVYHELDTDHDGVLTMTDDSYEPTIPATPTSTGLRVALPLGVTDGRGGNNEITEPPHKFIDMLTGTYDGTAGDDLGVPDFYQVYGVQHHKPVAIVETAAIFTPVPQRPVRTGCQTGMVASGVLGGDTPALSAAQDDQLVRMAQVRDRDQRLGGLARGRCARHQERLRCRPAGLVALRGLRRCLRVTSTVTGRSGVLSRRGTTSNSKAHLGSPLLTCGNEVICHHEVET